MKLSEKELKYIREGLLLLVDHNDNLAKISDGLGLTNAADGFKTKVKEISILYLKVLTQGN